MSELINRLRWSCQYYGMPITCLSVCARIAARFGWNFGSSPRFLAFKDRTLDRRFNISTVEQVPTSELGGEQSLQKHAIQYQPTSSLDLVVVLDRLSRQVNLRKFSFVDFGSGKGRVILMASEFPFQSVMGVEFSAALHEMARKNISSFRNPRQMCCDVIPVCQDAREFQLPDGPIIAFFFNPFDAVIMNCVLNNIEESVQRANRVFFCIYHNPVHRRLLDESAFWTEVSGWPIEREQWAIYRAGKDPIPAQHSRPVEVSEVPAAIS